LRRPVQPFEERRRFARPWARHGAVIDRRYHGKVGLPQWVGKAGRFGPALRHHQMDCSVAFFIAFPCRL
jgi:hypothetical protein